MLKSLQIENFRCFQRYELQQLGRLNLLVGDNNSGKTSIIEAVNLLTARDNLESLREIMLKRGEYLFDEETNRRELEIRHLFHGRELTGGNTLSVTATNLNFNSYVSLQVRLTNEENSPSKQEYEFFMDRSFDALGEVITDSLSVDMTLPQRRKKQKYSDWSGLVGVNTQFMHSSALSPHQTLELFDAIVLTPEEDLVLESLRIIEPQIMRIAPILTGFQVNDSTARGGFFVKLSGHNRRVPIGSMGDGMWRMLSLALVLVNARNGFLLVDEIDTGLHFSAMSDMWRLIWRASKRLNVQVFATTHSSDCWTSLAEVSKSENSDEDITIHRIEKGKESSVVFTEQQIKIAVERGIEVR